MNYISKFNGSKYQIPQDALITLHEEDHEEDEKVAEQPGDKKTLSGVFKEINYLISDKVKLTLHLKLLVMFIVANIVYIMCIFNAQ